MVRRLTFTRRACKLDRLLLASHMHFLVPSVFLSPRMSARFFSAFLLCALLFTIVSPPPAQAQTDGVLFIDGPAQRFLERQKTLGRLPGTFVSNRPLSAYEMQSALDSLTANYGDELSEGEKRWIARLRNEVPQPGAGLAQSIWGRLYPNGRDMAAVTGDGYALQLNPLLYTSLGRASFNEGEAVTTWRNTRGVRASGQIGPIFFESRLTENQERPAVDQFSSRGREGTAPRQGFVLSTQDRYYDYFQVSGSVGFRSKFFEVRFGRDQNRWGHGQGSVFLSDYPSTYDQLQVRTSVWRLQYTNLFTGFTNGERLAPQGERSDAVQPRSYGAMHRLAFDITNRLQIELFEAIVFAPESDSTVSRQGFDIAYLNPIIFYRAIERELGSPDNAMVGIGGSWITTPGFKVYGQFLLDELIVSEIGNEWWGNKWGWMLGAHLVNPGIEHLEARVEYARLRPYLYAHVYPPNAYAHYGDGLGHPAGPNSQDMSLFLDYQPPGRWQGGLVASYVQRGRNTETENFGSDPLVDNDTRVRSRGVSFLQGVRQDRLMLEAYAAVELLPQLHLQGSLRTEKLSDDESGDRTIIQPSIALRWGFPFDRLRF